MIKWILIWAFSFNYAYIAYIIYITPSDGGGGGGRVPQLKDKGEILMDYGVRIIHFSGSFHNPKTN